MFKDNPIMQKLSDISYNYDKSEIPEEHRILLFSQKDFRTLEAFLEDKENAKFVGDIDTIKVAVNQINIMGFQIYKSAQPDFKY